MKRNLYVQGEPEVYLNNPWNNITKDLFPETVTVSNGIILPYKPSKKCVWGLGGVVDGAGEFVAESHYKNGWAEFGGEYPIDKEPTVIDKDVIWMGVFFKHWGHFLLDLVNRLWYALENPNKYLVAYVSAGDEIDGNFLRFMELLGINKDDIILVKEPTQFSSVIIPDISYIKFQKYSDKYMSLFNAVARNSDSLKYVEKWRNKKVYFSREHYRKGLKAKEFGEDRIEKLLTRNGYISVKPENLSLDEQVTIWNNAQEIICINGTIPLNLLLCSNQDVNVIVLNKTSRPHENLFAIEEIKSQYITYVDIYDGTLTNPKFELGSGPFIMTLTKQFCDFFNEHIALDSKEEIAPEKSTWKDKVQYGLVAIYRLLK